MGTEICEPFLYKGEIVDTTIGTLLDAVCRIDHAEEAAYFMAEYRKVNAHADENVGYIIGYCGPETRQRLYRIFPKHPILLGLGRERDEA